MLSGAKHLYYGVRNPSVAGERFLKMTGDDFKQALSELTGHGWIYVKMTIRLMGDK